MAPKTSRLVLPNDSGHIPGALAYARALCRESGFTAKEAEDVSEALREACDNVVAHAFEPGVEAEYHVIFEFIPGGLEITVEDMGLPFSPERRDGPGLRTMEERMDRVRFINRGREGKEVVLVKYRRGRHVEDIFSARDLTPFDFCEFEPEVPECEIRLMAPEEAVEVSRCIYRSYGYTYLNEDFYFPERIEARLREGRMISAVAVSPEDGVVGHFAVTPRPNGITGEIGVAVVHPRYRGRGIMSSLLELLIGVAEEKGFTALYGNAFTMHDASQKTNLRFGFHETALQLGGIPPRSIRPLAERDLKGAGGVFSCFRYLKASPRRAVYLPVRHREILEETLDALGLARRIEGSAASSLEGDSSLELVLKPLHHTALVKVARAGDDLERRVRAKRLELADEGFNTVFVDLDLSDPATPEAAGRLESVGFFYSGLLPDYSEGDVLRLQYYMTEIHYDEVVAYSDFAKRLKEYVKSLDPKLRAMKAPSA